MSRPDESSSTMKEQVYKDPRPKEYFDRFHERVAPRAAADFDLRARARVHLDLRVDVLPRARHRRREGPADGPGDPRAEPLLVHGPLLHRRVHPAPACASWPSRSCSAAADAVDLHPRRRLPGPPRRARRGGLHHRPHRSSSAAARSSCTARAGARAPAELSEKPKRGIGRLALESGAIDRPGRDPRLLAACATGSAASSRRSYVQYGDAIRWPQVDEPDARAAAGRRRRDLRAASATLYDALDAELRAG